MVDVSSSWRNWACVLALVSLSQLPVFFSLWLLPFSECFVPSLHLFLSLSHAFLRFFSQDCVISGSQWWPRTVSSPPSLAPRLHSPFCYCRSQPHVPGFRGWVIISPSLGCLALWWGCGNEHVCSPNCTREGSGTIIFYFCYPWKERTAKQETCRKARHILSLMKQRSDRIFYNTEQWSKSVGQKQDVILNKWHFNHSVYRRKKLISREKWGVALIIVRIS